MRTPGPLVFIKGKDNFQGEIKTHNILGTIVDVDGWHVARIWDDCPDEKTAEIYARFIVTACNLHDDLVAALESLLSPEGWFADKIESAKAILAKAKEA